MKKRLYILVLILININFVGYADSNILKINDKNVSTTLDKKISPEELLIKIASGASVKEIESYLKHGTKAVVGIQSLVGQPLFIAARDNNIEMVKLLLKYNTPVDKKTLFNGTALNVASYLDHIEIVKLLLDAKADPFQTNPKGYTSIELAKANNSKKVMKLYADMGLIRSDEEIKKDFETNKKRFKEIFSKVSSKVDYDYKMKDIYGNEIKIKVDKEGLLVHGLDNKIIIIEIFGYRCPMCKKMEFVYERLKKKYKDDLEIISIEAQNAPDKKLEEIAAKTGLVSVIVPMKEGNDFIRFIQNNTSWQGALPFMLIIDKQHKLKYVVTGAKSLNEMIYGIDQINKQ